MTRILFALLLLGCAAAYGAFRAGRLRVLARYRLEPGAPPFLRRLPFLTLPLGAFALAGLLMAVVAGTGPVLGTGALAGVCALLVALVMAAAWLAWSPPDLLKPSWLRQEDSGHRKLEGMPPPMRNGDAGPHGASAAREARTPAAASKWRFAWQADAVPGGGQDDRDGT